ncbi:MAG TPA: hypothetical protein VJQ52_24210 [Steroidobacteraceae bacterium]|nr:hypothetical protein [Steroidobacteraceae bacterium]
MKNAQRRLDGTTWIALAAAVMSILTACGGGAEYSDGLRAPTPDPGSGTVVPDAPRLSDWHGRFVGTATIGGEQRFADAILTVDGAIRLYVGGPANSNGGMQFSKPGEAAQFVGSFTERLNNSARATGTVIGEHCGSSTSSLCSELPQAELQLAPTASTIEGELRFTTAAGSQTWSVELIPWAHHYVEDATAGGLTGQYREEIADYASAGDTVVNIDSAGRLFFQSATSGCTGNGTLQPHLDGAYNVYDVAMIIDSCKASRSALNGAFTGLATTSSSSYWDYDVLLRMWLSKADALEPAALTTLAR